MASRKEYELMFALSAQTGSNFNAAFKSAQAAIQATQKEVNALKSTQSDISAYQKQQAAAEQTQKKLELLQTQYDNIQKEINETEGYSSSLENKLASKAAQIEKTTAKLDGENESLGKLQKSLKEAGVDTDNLSDESARLQKEVNALREEQLEAAQASETFGEKASSAMLNLNDVILATGITKLISGMVDAFKSATDAAIEYESAITGVYKTVDGTDEQLANISAEIRQMSTEMPATTTEIAAVAEAAGQLGIATEDVTSFTRTMINMGEATNLTADDAATALAKFANISGTAASDYNRLGSVIVDLGNNFATTESDITQMGTRLASAGKLAGLTEPEVFALAAAMSSVGIEAEAGGTAMTQTLSAIETAVAEGEDSLQGFADVAGMSAQEFADEWNNNAIGALTAFIAGLGSLDEQGESAVLVLDELGLSGVRQSNMLKSLGLAADMMGTAVDTANKAWDENIALTNEANKRYSTTESQQAMMANAANNLAVVYGELYTPALKEAYSAGTDILVQLADFVEQNPAAVKGVTTFAGVIGTATAAITGFTAVSKIATAASTAFGAATGVALGPIAIGVAAVGALAGGVVALASAYDDANVSVAELTETAAGTTQALEDAQASFDDTSTSIMATAQVADTYITALEELEATGLKTDEAQKQYHNTLMLLSEAVPALADKIDLQTDSIDGGTAALRANADAWMENAKAQAYQDYMSDVMAQYNAVMEETAANEVELTKAQIQAEKATKGMDTTYQAILKTLGMTDAQFKATYGSVDNLNSVNTGLDMMATGLADLQTEYAGYRDELGEAEDAQQLYLAALEEGQEALDEAQAGIDEASEAYERLTSGADDAATAIDDGSSDIAAALATVDEQIQSLAGRYNEAYNAALESINGQYELWDEAAAVSATSIGSINSNLEGQISYWQEYNANIQALTDKAGDIEGLSDVIATFADGSADSVNAIAGMANASDEDLAKMVESYKQLQETQAETSESLADLTTNFSNEMDKLQSDLESDIAAMDLSDEAKQAGIATINGYIAGAASLSSQVYTAYAQLGNSAMAALRGNRSSNTSQGYATGTTNATSGVHLVGEYGPELVAFRGGESVLNAAQTKDALSSPINISLSPSYTFSGNGDGMDSMLQQQNDSLRTMILEVIEEAQADSRRRAFA